MSLIAPIPAPKNLSDQAAEALRHEILSCRLMPGAAISESLMTGRFSFGRAPVRAALARLADEGLVQALPRRGWVVSMVTIRDIHEVFDLRMVLEPEGARRAAGRLGDAAVLRRLDGICARGYRAGDHDSALAFLAANRDFHVAVAALSGNQRLERQVARLLDEATRMLVLGLAHRDRSGEMAHEHRALIAALARGDGAASADLMRAQVATSRAMVLSALTGPESPIAVAEVAV